MAMQRWHRETTTFVAIGSIVTLMPGMARGQEPAAEGALAEMLYRQGRALVAEGKVPEACPKFAESYRLDPATGTLLNLAWCHESERKHATAWLEFSRAVALARRDRRYDRVRFAEERLAVLETKLSYLTVVVPPANDAPGLDVRVDGVAVRTAARGVSMPVDLGDHTVEATAPGRHPWSQRVSVSEVATKVSVLVPALEPDAPIAPIASEPSTAPASPTAPLPKSVYVAGAVTLALAAAAGVTAYVYMDHRARYGAEQSEPELGRTRTWGQINLVLDLGALVGAGVTGYLYVTRPTVAASGRVERVRVAPWVRPGAGGFGLQGAF
jgi:hypothetical protein